MKAINRLLGFAKLNNPNLKVKFRFLTRSQIGTEQDSPFGEGKSQPGLHVWKHCSGDEAAITKISEFLQTEAKISEEVADFLKKDRTSTDL